MKFSSPTTLLLAIIALLFNVDLLLAQPATANPAAKLAELVESMPDLSYAGNDNPKQKIDLFLPKNRSADRKLPVLVYIHGGGWSGGDRKGGADGLKLVAAQGNYATASVGYRLSKEQSWPAQIHDCKAAIRWLKGNAEKFGLDPDRIGVWGTSAGGHLVSLLGTTAGNKDLNGSIGEFTNRDNQVRCVIDQCGPSDLTVPIRVNPMPQQPDAIAGLVAGLLGGPLDEKMDNAKAASPLLHVSPKAAPILMIHGSDDDIVSFEQSKRFHAAMKKAGASSILLEVTNAGHGIPLVPELRTRFMQFLDLHLRDIKAEISDAAIVVPKPVAK